MSENYEYGVTVLCCTYNQEEYVRQTLEGFAMQKTNFKVEYLIHDDASTDGTADIIREYAKKYPDRFFPMIEEVNQYSQHVDFLHEQMLQAVKGKYIAICEGDDYWTDPMKLQMQYDALESHPECSMCVHGTNGISEDASKIVRTFPEIPLEEGVISAKTVIHNLLGEHLWNFHTTSYFMRSKNLKAAWNDGWEFYVHSMYPDHAMVLVGAYCGDFYYIDRKMSDYRIAVSGSITTVATMREKRNKLRFERSKRGIHEVEAFDEMTNYKFHEDVLEYINFMKLYIAEATGDYKYVLAKEQRKYFKTWPKRARYRIMIARYFPWFDQCYFTLRELVHTIKK